MNRTNLISYASSFTSFLLDSKVGSEIVKIILFGSVARGDFSSESDVDIFVECDPALEKEVGNVLKLFEMSATYKTWKIKGVTQDILVKIGWLKDWSLRRDIISSGVLLYGKYNELPNVQYYALIRIEGIGKRAVSHQMTIFRALYGYVQKVGKKVYQIRGLLEKNNGIKLGKGVFVVPMERRQEIFSFLNKNKIMYKIHEVWAEGF